MQCLAMKRKSWTRGLSRGPYIYIYALSTGDRFTPSQYMRSALNFLLLLCALHGAIARTWHANKTYHESNLGGKYNNWSKPCLESCAFDLTDILEVQGQGYMEINGADAIVDLTPALDWNVSQCSVTKDEIVTSPPEEHKKKFTITLGVTCPGGRCSKLTSGQIQGRIARLPRVCKSAIGFAVVTQVSDMGMVGKSPNWIVELSSDLSRSVKPAKFILAGETRGAALSSGDFPASFVGKGGDPTLQFNKEIPLITGNPGCGDSADTSVVANVSVVPDVAIHARVGFSVTGSVGPIPSVDEAHVYTILNGQVGGRLNLALDMEGELDTKEVSLVTIPVAPLYIGFVSVGPSIELLVRTNGTISVSGTLSYGVQYEFDHYKISLPSEGSPVKPKAIEDRPVGTAIIAGDLATHIIARVNLGLWAPMLFDASIVFDTDSSITAHSQASSQEKIPHGEVVRQGFKAMQHSPEPQRLESSATPANLHSNSQNPRSQSHSKSTLLSSRRHHRRSFFGIGKKKNMLTSPHASVLTPKTKPPRKSKLTSLFSGLSSAATPDREDVASAPVIIPAATAHKSTGDRLKSIFRSKQSPATLSESEPVPKPAPNSIGNRLKSIFRGKQSPAMLSKSGPAQNPAPQSIGDKLKSIFRSKEPAITPSKSAGGRFASLFRGSRPATMPPKSTGGKLASLFRGKKSTRLPSLSTRRKLSLLYKAKQASTKSMSTGRKLLSLYKGKKSAPPTAKHSPARPEPMAQGWHSTAPTTGGYHASAVDRSSPATGEYPTNPDPYIEDSGLTEADPVFDDEYAAPSHDDQANAFSETYDDADADSVLDDEYAVPTGEEEADYDSESTDDGAEAGDTHPISYGSAGEESSRLPWSLGDGSMLSLRGQVGFRTHAQAARGGWLTNELLASLSFKHDTFKAIQFDFSQRAIHEAPFSYWSSTPSTDHGGQPQSETPGTTQSQLPIDVNSLVGMRCHS